MVNIFIDNHYSCRHCNIQRYPIIAGVKGQQVYIWRPASGQSYYEPAISDCAGASYCTPGKPRCSNGVCGLCSSHDQCVDFAASQMSYSSYKYCNVTSGACTTSCSVAGAQCPYLHICSNGVCKSKSVGYFTPRARGWCVPLTTTPIYNPSTNGCRACQADFECKWVVVCPNREKTRTCSNMHILLFEGGRSTQDRCRSEFKYLQHHRFLIWQAGQKQSIMHTTIMCTSARPLQRPLTPANIFCHQTGESIPIT